jgi:transcriptional regulator with XRE-family HTH domain
MPLDTGDIVELDAAAAAGNSPDLLRMPAPDLQSGADIGRALRAVRLFKGLSLEDVAQTTRVRRLYLAAIEDMQLDRLPSRPFTIGYIRAYAGALGLDADAAVERFKAEEPVLDEPLRAPVGVSAHRDPRLVAFVVGAMIILTAIVFWNIAQRLMAESAPPHSTAPASFTVPPAAPGKTGPVVLGAPLPAPVESTTPALYETPGLAQAGPDGRSRVGLPHPINAAPPGHVPINPATLPQTFTPQGRIYDSGAQLPSSVTLQALKGASLMIRGVDSSIYFARQLSAGEAYRVPQVAGLVVEVTDPEAFQVFAGGVSRGVLPGLQVAAGKLDAPAQ